MKDMQMSKIKVGTLVEDFDLYPRASVDSTHVQHIVEAIESGIVLPSIIAEKKTLRIVDGFHRSRAYKRLHGADYKIDVELREYPSERALFLAAMRLNSGHGRNMTPYDRAHAMLRAEKLKIEPMEVAAALNMTCERLNEIRTHQCVQITGTRRSIPLKLPIRHMRGRQLSPAQEETSKHLGGNQQVFYVNTVIRLIESRLLDKDNDALMSRLSVLAELLDKQFDVK
jgi:hypothetical protein